MNFPIGLTPRALPSKALRWLSPVLALILTVAAGFVLFSFLGKDPWDSLYVFLLAPLENLRGWTEVGVKMTPLLLCAVGLVVCFRTSLWNIGAEGQLIVGALLAGWVALQATPETGSWFIVPVLAAGAIGGALWGGIAAWLKNQFHANEILVTLMLVYVAQYLLAYCVLGPLQDPDGLGFPQSAIFESAAALPHLIAGTRLHAGFVLAILAALFCALLMGRMFVGFEIKVSGLAPMAAKYAGFHPQRLTWFAFLFSGACAGLAGACEVTGPIGQLILNVSPGYGFAAIIVAFVGRLSPLGCIPAAFIMALFYLGGELGQTRLGLPSSITGVYQGMLLFFLLVCDVFIHFRLVWRGFARRAQS